MLARAEAKRHCTDFWYGCPCQCQCLPPSPILPPVHPIPVSRVIGWKLCRDNCNDLPYFTHLHSWYIGEVFSWKPKYRPKDSPFEWPTHPPPPLRYIWAASLCWLDYLSLLCNGVNHHLQKHCQPQLIPQLINKVAITISKSEPINHWPTTDSLHWLTVFKANWAMGAFWRQIGPRKIRLLKNVCAAPESMGPNLPRTFSSSKWASSLGLS